MNFNDSHTYEQRNFKPDVISTNFVDALISSTITASFSAAIIVTFGFINSTAKGLPLFIVLTSTSSRPDDRNFKANNQYIQS